MFAHYFDYYTISLYLGVGFFVDTMYYDESFDIVKFQNSKNQHDYLRC